MGGNASSVRVVPAGVAGQVPVTPPGAAQFGSRAELEAAPRSGRTGERVERPVGGSAPGSSRRVPARRIGPGPEPTGPGRSARRPAPVMARSSVRSCTPAARRALPSRGSAARPVPVRPAPARLVAARRVGRARPAGLASAAQFVLVAVVAAVVVGALGLLADGVRAARVPEATGLVQVHSGESIWQVARRAAPSADPGAVAARIVELNDLGSPSVRGGEVVLSPIG